LGFCLQEAVSSPPLSSSAKAGGTSSPRLLDSIIDVSGILDRPPQCAVAHKADDDKCNRHCERSEEIHRAAYRPPYSDHSSFIDSASSETLTCPMFEAILRLRRSIPPSPALQRPSSGDPVRRHRGHQPLQGRLQSSPTPRPVLAQSLHVPRRVAEVPTQCCRQLRWSGFSCLNDS
jgi:hypothetical protein